jgi:membrane fusion protein, multidrug efflux system
MADGVPEASEQAQVEEDVVVKQPSFRTRHRLLTWLVINVVAVVAILLVARWWHYAQTHQQTDDAVITGHVHNISTRIPGTVSAVYVQDNQLVKPGEVLVQLDPRDNQVRVQQAAAAVAVAQKQAVVAAAQVRLSQANAKAVGTGATGSIYNAQSGIARAKAGLAEAQSAVKAATDQVAQNRADYQRAASDLQRYQNLAQQGAVSIQQAEQARRDYDVSRARLAQSQEQVAEANSRVRQAQAAIGAAQAAYVQSQGTRQQAVAASVQTNVNATQYDAARTQISQAQAGLAEAKLLLSYTTITAPSAGRVGRKQVEVGQRLQPGQPLLAIVSNDVWITANFKETQLERMRPGQPVDIKVDAFPSHHFKGYVDSFSPASGAQFALLPPENATGNYTKIVQRVPVKIVFDPVSIKGFETALRPGMSVVPTVDVAAKVVKRRAVL